MDFFLNEIKQKAIQNIRIHGKLADTLQSIAGFAKYAFIFDAEFQRVYGNGPEKRHILEFGGILFQQDNQRNWIYVGNFHFNLPPVSKNVGLIHSTFLTVTPKTQLAMDEIEQHYMFYPKLEQLKDSPAEFKKYYNYLMKLPVVHKKKMPKLDPDTEPNKIIKLFKNLTFQLNRKDVGHYAFKQMWKLYLNDPLVKQRMLYPSKKWLLSFRHVLENSLLIVKGMNDIIAIDHLFESKKIDKIQDKVQTLDIAVYNGAFRETCKSAELEKSYWCIINNNLMDPDMKPILKNIYQSLVVKEVTAHNPLVDAFYTLIVAISMHSILVKNI
jgi:hypothetical protein